MGGMRALGCSSGIRDPVRCLGVKPGPPALGPLSLAAGPPGKARGVVVNTPQVASHTQLCAHSASVPCSTSHTTRGSPHPRPEAASRGRWEPDSAETAVVLSASGALVRQPVLHRSCAHSWPGEPGQEERRRFRHASCPHVSVQGI